MSKFESYQIVRSFERNLQIVGNPENWQGVVGVSGGPDSMALLYLLHRFECHATVVHCNYQLRGEDSEKDQTLVEKTAAMWGFDAISARLDISSDDPGNFQNRAREKRYEIFTDLKKELNANYVFTAHHQDDQIETILQKLLRGSGIGAWSGMEVLDGYLFRPLLEIPKHEIMTFVSDHNIPYRIDQSNEESTYARNFLRHQWFPEIHKYFPGWRSNILSLQQRAEEFDLMSGLLFNQCLDEEGLVRKRILNLPSTLWPVIIHYYSTVTFPGIQISKGALEQTDKLYSLDTGQSIQLADNLYFLRNRSHFILEKKSDTTPLSVTLTKDDLNTEFHWLDKHIKLSHWEGHIHTRILQLDAETIRFPIQLRTWTDGDMIQPLGMQGRKLISDLLTDQKISSHKKRESIVLESFDGTICAVIFPHPGKNGQPGMISDQFKCSVKTKNILTIE